MKKINVVLAATIAMTSVAPAMTSYADMEYVKRFSGNDRVKTAIEVSKGNFSANTTNLILVNGSNPADALSGGPLAWKLKAPILLVGKTSVTNETLAEIKRLNPKNVYILGGVNSISASIEKIAKANAPGVNIKRIAGNDRYETSTKVAEEIVGSSKTNGAGFVNGKTAKFPDALSAAALVGSKGMPLILTNGSTLPKGTEGYKGNSKNYIVGGTNSISIYGLKGKRLSGNDRFATSAAVATEGFKDAMQEYTSSTGNAKYNNCVVVDGTNYPDALTAISVARKYNAPILLTNKNSVPSPIIRYMNDQGRDKAFIIGGLNSVSSGVANVLKARMEANYKINSSNEMSKKKAVIKGLLSDLSHNDKLLALLKNEGSGVKSEKAKYKKLIEEYKKKYEDSKPEDLKNVSLETLEAGRKAVQKAFDKIMDVKDDCFRIALIEQENAAYSKQFEKDITEDSKKKLKALLDDADEIKNKSGKNKEKLELALKLKDFKVKEESGGSEGGSTADKTDQKLIDEANDLIKEINKDDEEKDRLTIDSKIKRINELCNSLSNLTGEEKARAREDLDDEVGDLRGIHTEYAALDKKLDEVEKYMDETRTKEIFRKRLIIVATEKISGDYKTPRMQLDDIKIKIENEIEQAEIAQNNFKNRSDLSAKTDNLKVLLKDYKKSIDNYELIYKLDESVQDNEEKIESSYNKKDVLDKTEVKRAYEKYESQMNKLKYFTITLTNEISRKTNTLRRNYEDAYDHFREVYNNNK